MIVQTRVILFKRLARRVGVTSSYPGLPYFSMLIYPRNIEKYGRVGVTLTSLRRDMTKC